LDKTKVAILACWRYQKGVPGLISKIDGMSAILFHVEQSSADLWHYRWRITGNYPAPYLVWREGTTKARFVKITVEICNCAIEVEWRAEPGDEWSQVALLELDYARSRFAVTALADFMAADGFTVCSVMRDDGVAAYRFPGLSLAAGEAVEVNAHADAPAWANVLLDPGEFQPRDDRLTVTNLGPSENAWREIPHSGAFQLSRCPLGAGRRWYARGHHAVDPGLLAQLVPSAP